MKEEKIIMYEGDEAAQLKTVTGWVSSDGRYWGQDERAARYAGSTHHKCDCGGIAERGYTICKSCRDKKDYERYMALPFKEYDGSPVVERDGDKYFFSEDDIEEYLADNDTDSIDLLFCDENAWSEVSADYWDDIMPPDDEGDLPKELEEALKILNAVIRKLPACSYFPGKVRTTYTLNPTQP